jgi:hypothetical protein
VSEKRLFDLFSEFTALVMIGRTANIEARQGSLQSNFKKQAESKDYLREIFPFAGSMNKRFKQKKA